MAEISDTPLAGLKLIRPRVFKDTRGYFLEAYRTDQLAEGGIRDVFVQDNEAGSSRGVLRGLHYQVAPHLQSKLVRVSRGSVFDVAVDIRKDSQTYGMWYGATLSAENKIQLYIPPDFAHGYLVLESGGLQVLPQRIQLFHLHIGQHQVLLVGAANFAKGVAVCQLRHLLQLSVGNIPRSKAGSLE